MDIEPKQIPNLGIPRGTTTVRVRAIDTTTRLVCDAFAFVQPVIPGHEKLNFKTLCFMIEHGDHAGNTEYMLFDCGARKDFWNGSPQTQRMIGGHVPALEVDYGVDEILTASGFELQNLKAIVWSHWHWDHVGDGSKFPPETDIVVGPGFTENFVPGWPTDPNGLILASDIEGHRLHEPEFPLTIGGFRACDYFGDGSFYLLDVPGHAIGHICGLARTTPDSFVFMGGDCCHYAGVLRPSPYKPLPSTIPSEQLDRYYPKPCPCSVFTVHHLAADAADSEQRVRTEPFYQISTHRGSAYSFGDVAQKTMGKLQLFDAHPDVFLCLAHDGALFDLLPLFNQDPKSDINDWKAQGYKERLRWAFLNELPKDGNKPGRVPLVIGLRRDGKMLAWKEGTGFYEA